MADLLTGVTQQKFTAESLKRFRSRARKRSEKHWQNFPKEIFKNRFPKLVGPAEAG
jgi:hypothetical protein